MVLSARISVRLSHDACWLLFSPAFQSFKRICPRKFKQISQQSSNRFVCTSGGLKGDMLEDPLEKPSTTFEAIKQGHFNPNPRLRQEPGTPYSVQCRGQSNSQKTSFFFSTKCWNLFRSHKFVIKILPKGVPHIYFMVSLWSWMY